MPTGAFSMKAASRASLARSASSIALRSLMSVTAVSTAGWPPKVTRPRRHQRPHRAAVGPAQLDLEVVDPAVDGEALDQPRPVLRPDVDGARRGPLEPDAEPEGLLGAGIGEQDPRGLGAPDRRC